VPLNPSRGSLRVLRAGVFTTVAVLLAAIGHSCAADVSSAALLSLLGAVPVIFAGAWFLAARRANLALVLVVSVGVQYALHLLLSRTSVTAAPSLAAFWCHTGPASSLPAGTALAGWHPPNANSSAPMLAAHLCAAAAAGVWMARGDRALESLLRLLTAASAALRVVQPQPTAAVDCAPDEAHAVTRSDWRLGWHLRHLQLVRTSVVRRGPPAYAC
jgi:hypothetical protein